METTPACVTPGAWAREATMPIEVARQIVELPVAGQGGDARGGDSFGRDPGIAPHEIGEPAERSAAGDEQERGDRNLRRREDDAKAMRTAGRMNSDAHESDGI